VKTAKLKGGIGGVVIIILVAFFSLSTICSAQEWSRRGKGEFYGVGQYMSGDSTTFTNTIKMDLDSNIDGGLGFGININEYLNMNFDINFGSKDYKATYHSIVLKESVTIGAMNFNLDIYPLKTRFTPLVTAGIGFMSFSGDVGDSTNSFSETDLSYNVGAGIRWDIIDHVFLKAIYKATWTNLKDSNSTLMFHGPALSIGFIF
jgi:opacity protein-like surface antigen